MNGEAEPRTPSVGADARPAAAHPSSVRAARAARQLSRSLLIVFLLSALVLVGLTARRVFASETTHIRWLLEGLVDAFNDGDREAILREFNPHRTVESPGSRQLETSRLLDRAWGAGRDGEGSTLRLELDEVLEVEVLPDDSIPIGIATGEVRLLDRAGTGSEALSVQRFRAVLNPSGRRSPWRSRWVIVYVEHVEVPGELPPLPR